MLIQLRQFDVWEQINGAIKKKLGITDSKITVHVFHNVGQAAFDFLLGLRQFLPHKKTIIYVEGGDPYLHSLTVPLFREAYHIITLKPHTLKNNPNWLSEIPATDILCVVTSRDHAFTGEHWIDDNNIKLLTEKKIPTLEVSHNMHFDPHFQDELTSRPFLLQVQDYEGISIGVLGSRTKVYPQSSALSSWNFDKSIHQFELARAKYPNKVSDQTAILNFEANVSSPAAPYFSKDFHERTFDRAIICLNKVTGDQFINHMKSKLNYDFTTSDFATPHLCQWGGFGHFSWWGHEGIQPEVQMTLIAVSIEFIHQKDSLKTFNEVLSACLQENKLV